MPMRLERTRYGSVYLAFTWAFGLLFWYLVSAIVGINVGSLVSFFVAQRLPLLVFLLLIVVCAFLRRDPGRSTEEWSEDAVTLCAVLVYPQEVAVALMGLAAVLVTVSQIASSRAPGRGTLPWHAPVGEAFFRGGLLAFATLAGGTVFRALYDGEPLRQFSPGDLWRIPLVFLAIYLVRLAIMFLHAASRGLPLLEFVRDVRRVHSLSSGLTEVASLLLGATMAVVYTSLGTPVFVVLGGVLVAVVALLANNARVRRELQARVVELRVLNAVGRALTDSARTRESLLAAVDEQARALFGADLFALYLRPGAEIAAGDGGRAASDDELYLDPAVGGGDAARDAGGDAGIALARLCARTHAPIRIDEAARQFGAYGLGGAAVRPAYASWLCVPLELNGKAQGVVAVAGGGPGTFSEQHAELLGALGRQLASALESAKLFEMAMLDGLTGLLTARYLRRRMAEEFEGARRSGKPFSVIMLDVDFFKRVNDTHGHEVGNDVLRFVARTVAGRLRESDVAARYGGEEFTVLLPGTPAAGALEVAERLRVALESEAAPTSAGPVAITASLGVASYPALAAETQDELIVAADAALYEAKRAGRNRVREALRLAARPAALAEDGAHATGPTRSGAHATGPARAGECAVEVAPAAELAPVESPAGDAPGAAPTR